MPERTSPGGFSDALQTLGASLLALCCARAELIAIELAEQRDHAKHEMLLGVIAALFLSMGMLLAAVFVVVVFWDTWRLSAAALVTLAYLAIGVGALLRLRRNQRAAPAPFAATMSEFAADLKALLGHDHDR